VALSRKKTKTRGSRMIRWSSRASRKLVASKLASESESPRPRFILNFYLEPKLCSQHSMVQDIFENKNIRQSSSSRDSKPCSAARRERLKRLLSRRPLRMSEILWDSSSFKIPIPLYSTCTLLEVINIGDRRGTLKVPGGPDSGA
jgi:hypothetical protein